MYRVVAVVSVAVLLLGMPSVVAAQDDDSPEADGPLTIEELYLEQDVDMRIIGSQARSSNRQTKALALQTVRVMLDDGRISSDNPEIVPILRGLALEGTARKTRHGSDTVVNNYPEIRRSAAQLLGEVGGAGAQDALVQVLRSDDEPMVLAEAVYALGLLGENDNNEVTNEIALLLRNQSSRTNPDNNLAFASLLALERIASVNNGVDDVLVIDAVLDIAAHGAYLRAVRLKAVETLYNLRGGDS